MMSILLSRFHFLVVFLDSSNGYPVVIPWEYDLEIAPPKAFLFLSFPTTQKISQESKI